MTHTTTIVERHAFGDMFAHMVKIDITSYTNGGEVITPSELGLVTVRAIDVMGGTENRYIARWNGVQGTSATAIKILGIMQAAATGAFAVASDTADLGEIYCWAYGYGH